MSRIDELGGWPAVISELLDRHDLPAAHARAAMATILAGEATAAQLIGFVVALKAKGGATSRAAQVWHEAFDRAVDP